MEYPQREKFFAHKLIRLMGQTALAAKVGPEVCWLLAIVAHAEDAMRYVAAPAFHARHLMRQLGTDRQKTFRRWRDRAVASGWLHYQNNGKRRPGTYWVTIPPASCAGSAPDDHDALCAESVPNNRPLCAESAPNNPAALGAQSAPNNHDALGAQSAPNEKPALPHWGRKAPLKTGLLGAQSAPPFNPKKTLSKNTGRAHPCCSARAQGRAQARAHLSAQAPSEGSDHFGAFWAAVPRKVSKRAAAAAFAKAVAHVARDQSLPEPDAAAYIIRQMAAFAASPSGAAAGQYCPYPATWLNAGRYDDDPAAWDRPSKADNQLTGTAAAVRQYLERKDTLNGQSRRPALRGPDGPIGSDVSGRT